MRLIPRPDGAPPPHDDAEKIADGLSAGEYQSICAEFARQLSAEHGIPVKHIRPSLVVLAELHADLRWSKKRRCIDLKKWGYDPDGDEGRAHNRHFHRAIQRREVRRIVESERRRRRD